MPWNRNEPDPLEIKRRKLREQERLLAEQMERLTRELHDSGEPLPEEIKRPEPPVWRRDDEDAEVRQAEPTPRHLARRRQRDMIVFFVTLAVVLVIVLVLWHALAHHAE